MKLFLYTKFFVIAFFLSIANISVAQTDSDSSLKDEDFLPINADSTNSPNKNTAKISKTESNPNIKEDGEGDTSSAKDKNPPKKSKNYESEEIDSKDYFDSNYIRKAAFYDLPFSEVDPEELSETEKDKLVSVLKRRLSIYKYVITKLETKIKEVGGEQSLPKRRSSSSDSNKNIQMPVEINGKEYDAINAILVAKSKNSVATAFFANIKNRNFIVTNMHVMQADSEVNFRTFNGVEIKMPKTGFYSKGNDVFILPINSIPEGCIALPIEDDVSNNLAVYDKLIVCGNSMGGGSFVHSLGEVVAVGPNIIEHNCNVQHGHSGSPIYSRKLKKVVGVLSHGMRFSYMEKGVKLGKNPNENLKIGERDFGYRIDNIRDWTQIKTDRLIEASNDYNRSLEKYKALYNAIHENSYSRSFDYRELNKIITIYNAKRKGSSVAYKEARIEFLKNVKNLIGHEIITLKNKKLDEIFAATTQLIDALENLQSDCNAIIKTE